MGLANLPLASGNAHVKAFERLGWKLNTTRRGRGKHFLLTKSGHRATLSIPDHHEVKRTIIAGLIKAAETSEEKYLKAFRGETFSDDYWVYEDNVTRTATVHRGDCQYCNHGAGMGRGRIERDNRWLGSYSTEDAIRSAPIRANSMLRKCGARPCRDDPALAWLG